MIIVHQTQNWETFVAYISDPEFKSKMYLLSHASITKQQITQLNEKMKNFGHVKVADYSLGATYISKWIYAMVKEAKEGASKPPPSRGGAVRRFDPVSGSYRQRSPPKFMG